MTENQTMVQASGQAVQVPNAQMGIQTAEGFQLIQRVVKMFSISSMLPQQYRGEQNIGNCVIALNMAAKMNVEPLMVMQNLYIIQGRPAWSTQFMISMFNGCGKFAPIRYKKTGKAGTDSQGCIAYTYDKVSGELIEGEEITIGIAKAEGWFNKNGSKWKTMLGQMLRYRAATWLIRSTAPELTMGLYAKDEVEEIDITPKKSFYEGVENFKNSNFQFDAGNVDTETGEVKSAAVPDYVEPDVEEFKSNEDSDTTYQRPDLKDQVPLPDFAK